jgi:hypothetical protein
VRRTTRQRRSRAAAAAPASPSARTGALRRAPNSWSKSRPRWPRYSVGACRVQVSSHRIVAGMPPSCHWRSAVQGGSARRRRQAARAELPARVSRVVQHRVGRQHSLAVPPDRARRARRAAAASRRTAGSPEPARGRAGPRRLPRRLGRPPPRPAARSRAARSGAGTARHLPGIPRHVPAPDRFLDWYFKALATDPLSGLAWYASHFIRIARAPKRMPR